MNETVLVNVGCGTRFDRRWINLDLIKRDGVTPCDITKGLPLESSSADAIYHSAVLEHIRPSNTHAFLKECHRVLKPQGILRVAVPDFEQQAKQYLESIQRIDSGVPNADADRQWMLLEMIDQSSREVSGGKMASYLSSPSLCNESFVVERIGNEGRELIQAMRGSTRRNDSAATPAKVRGRSIGRFLLKWLLGSQDVDTDLLALSIGRFRLSGEVHQWAYDRYSISTLLQEANYKNVKICNHGTSQIDNWNDYGLEIDNEGRIIKPDLMIAECTKP
ncbi:methyltransferase domain-containing protein [Novipirellula sp.]|uniref:class I SAM-dependent methyltransferase n=1 Tax=Novipirellula sp. TaxID=2795430 RepID=UPI00356AC044